MLIAIAGSQGSGKTTVIQQLKSQGYPVIERKTARSILMDWGYTLDAVNADFDLKQVFQDELVTRKFNDELEASRSEDIIFTERTFSDLFTYALISFGQYNKYDDWVNRYFDKCHTNCEIYSHVFYLQAMFSADIENDGVRSTNQHYSQMVDNTMLSNTHRMVNINDITIINEDNIETRIDIISNIIKDKPIKFT